MAQCIKNSKQKSLDFFRHRDAPATLSQVSRGVQLAAFKLILLQIGDRQGSNSLQCYSRALPHILVRRQSLIYGPQIQFVQARSEANPDERPSNDRLVLLPNEQLDHLSSQAILEQVPCTEDGDSCALVHRAGAARLPGNSQGQPEPVQNQPDARLHYWRIQQWERFKELLADRLGGESHVGPDALNEGCQT